MKREFQYLQTVQRRRRLGKGKLASILSKSSCGNFLQIFSSMLEQEFSSSSEPSKWWEECGRQAINESGSIKSASLYTPERFPCLAGFFTRSKQHRCLSPREFPDFTANNLRGWPWHGSVLEKMTNLQWCQASKCDEKKQNL